ncbi:protein of unknown function [Pseudorhizobium banfieldiae]|uniref:Uncharacterized protein n=1 Tax=Pseudorhizobium banfieldiae TaxID=1125847 RepID=L0NDY8_9HYPH|nr:recombinase RecT [Pseudorhizobium banfieldiae]CAD6605921.1 DNA recombination protein RecT [arsenite-oxidising bacterium NT-25]CCF19094.1 protein of unknown function [Pseudorhizobium banfieldiae]
MSNQITVSPVNPAPLLEGLRADLAPLLQEAGQSFDRLRTVFMTAVQQNPDILLCSEDSIRREIRKCAADGLVPDNKEAAMIPYKGELQYQPMVLGIIKRVKELGGVFRIDCKLVYKNDEFVLDEADPNSLSHKSNPFASAEERGPVVGGYAVFRDEAGNVMHLETMSLEDFERVRKASKAPNSPAWRDWTNEMYRKAVLRRGAKYIAVNNDKIRALLERQDELFDFTQPRMTERVNPFTGEVIDASATPALEHRQQMGMNLQNDGDRVQEPRQQRNDSRDGGKDRRQPERSPQGSSEPKQADKKQDEKPPETKPDTLPEVPDLMIAKGDEAKALEAVEKILAIALNAELDAPARRGVLKSAAPSWKEQTPEYLHPLVRACVDATDWAIKKDAAGEPWSADHAVFVHKVKTLLEVEKLNIGKYPS